MSPRGGLSAIRLLSGHVCDIVNFQISLIGTSQGGTNCLRSGGGVNVCVHVVCDSLAHTSNNCWTPTNSHTHLRKKDTHTHTPTALIRCCEFCQERLIKMQSQTQR